ncbi:MULTISPECIES: hypothetical protein [unclassified Enterococcus]|uniref:hypothetical protein n=1 Tax=unclassified Enterococcus TaxID=2608891 RepID=UPI0015554236|nr:MULTISPECIES: hypothetical protein [unclassified Enterococcus]MBS7578353.1 hypothetical protein [Enterococcus sp. MMGLQ5-2]MBS7585590.1 hypothetical protein [Enterococcus sp. MMGLQ5-1]NPD13449.1 hypothetical protein [Enterococcus sp. MMGLQ5-1]NPD38184.1 hypothetical protein [Enterococcus sp. MMGLQ5-2]
MEKVNKERKQISKVHFPFFSDDDLILDDEGALFFENEALITDYTDKFDLEQHAKAERQTKSDFVPQEFDTNFIPTDTVEPAKNARLIDLDREHARYQQQNLSKNKAPFVQIRSGVKHNKNPIFNKTSLDRPANERSNLAEKPNFDKIGDFSKKQLYSGGLNRFKPRPTLPPLSKHLPADDVQALDETKIKAAFKTDLLFDYDKVGSDELRSQTSQKPNFKDQQSEVWQYGAPRVSAEQKKAIVTATNKDKIAPRQQTIFSGGTAHQTIFNSRSYQPVFSERGGVNANAQDAVAQHLNLEQTIDHSAKQRISDQAVKRFGEKE